MKKIGKRVDVTVVFCALNKLSVNLVKMSITEGGLRAVLRSIIISSLNAEKVLYSIPLSCGKQYIGQTGRWLMTDKGNSITM